MNENLQILCTTQEFADLCGVSKHTLFHYDALGIFCPAVRGGNGYRYYSPAQLEVFQVIAGLKELDMPLSEIKAYLDRRSPRELVTLLTEKAQELRGKIDVLSRVENLIRQKAALTERVLGADLSSIAVTWEEEQYLVLTPVRPLMDERDIAYSVAEHVRYCESHGIYSAHSMGSLIEREAAGRGDSAGYSHFYTQVDERPSGLSYDVRPPGKYLVAYHTSGYDNVFDTYRRMLKYGDMQGLLLGGFFYEDTLLDELSVRGYDKYVLRLSIAVEN